MLRGNQAAHIVERACNEWIGNAGTVLGFYIDDESKGAAIRGAGSEANVKGNSPLGQRLVFCISPRMRESGRALVLSGMTGTLATSGVPWM